MDVYEHSAYRGNELFIIERQIIVKTNMMNYPTISITIVGTQIKDITQYRKDTRVT